MLLFLLGSQVNAQGNDFVPIKDVAAFKERMKATAAKTTSFVADFQQEKTLIALTEKITSTGKFWYKKTNKVRMEYVKPFSYRMIINGDKIHIKDSQKDYAVNAGSNKLFQQINRIMVDCVQGTILENKDFKSRVLEGKNSYRVELIPISKGLKDFYSSIVLNLSKEELTINTIEMNESGDDKTIMYFKNIRINAPVEESVFVP
jgi:outer membrane lipoprotein-sorting protein